MLTEAKAAALASFRGSIPLGGILLSCSWSGGSSPVVGWSAGANPLSGRAVARQPRVEEAVRVSGGDACGCRAHAQWKRVHEHRLGILLSSELATRARPAASIGFE